MTPLCVEFVTFVAFASAAFLATRAAEWAASSWPRLRDRPVLGVPNHAVTAALVLGTGWIGASYVARGAGAYALLVLVTICLTLDFACCCDLRVGRLPAAVTVPALGLLFASALVTRDWMAPLGCVVVAAPFALAALRSKNKGQAWGDVQVVMLGAIVLNLPLGLVTLALACIVAVCIAFVRRKMSEPIVFAPYLAFSIEIALLTPNAIA